MPETTQPVATEANGAAAPTPEAVSGAQDDLDSLLAQFDAPKLAEQPKPEQAKPETKPEEPKAAAPDPGTEARLRAIEAEFVDRDINNAVSVVKHAMGDSASRLPDSLIRGALQDQASRDPRFARAWQQRGSNKAAFEKVLDGLGRQLSKELATVPDANATEDKAALRAAVRSASTVSPATQEFDAKSWVSMTPAQRAAEKRKLAGG